jgi:hypothetical protein
MQVAPGVVCPVEMASRAMGWVVRRAYAMVPCRGSPRDPCNTAGRRCIRGPGRSHGIERTFKPGYHAPMGKPYDDATKRQARQVA